MEGKKKHKTKKKIQGKCVCVGAKLWSGRWNKKKIWNRKKHGKPGNMNTQVKQPVETVRRELPHKITLALL